MGTISPAGENVRYNSSTREIVWDADRIARGAGINGPVRSVAFQLAFKPSVSQVGSNPIIINDAILTGHDDFANVDVKVNKAGLTTKLDGDEAFPQNGGIVIP
jgi:hypothetical protein